MVPILTDFILSISMDEWPESNKLIPNIFDDISFTVKYESHVINIVNTKNSIYFLNHIDGPSVLTGKLTILLIDIPLIEYTVNKVPTLPTINNNNTELFWYSLLWYKHIIKITEISEIISQILNAIITIIW